MDLAVLYWILVGLMALGALGELIPGMPGASLILAAILVWSVATEFAGIGWPIVIVFALLILSAAVEFLAAYWGAKQFGASRWGQFGALIGLVVGVLGLLPALPFGGPILGILVGPFVGAFIGEYLSRQPVEGESKLRTALRASVGTVVGSVIGNLIDGLLAIAAVVVFVISTWPFVTTL
ncbi:MAG: DUF456 domain-containing protein [Leptolyngbya sp. SIO4C1]|nr:DUF456 domain-containing protein [Leptolyngbya sp. SIO4C1]